MTKHRDIDWSVYKVLHVPHCGARSHLTCLMWPSYFRLAELCRVEKVGLVHFVSYFPTTMLCSFGCSWGYPVSIMSSPNVSPRSGLVWVRWAIMFPRDLSAIFANVTSEKAFRLLEDDALFDACYSQNQKVFLIHYI